MAYSQVPNTATTIQIAKASLCYAGRDISRKNFRQNTFNVNLKKQLWVASEVLDWTYTNDPTADYIKQLRNYTLALCGGYIGEALAGIGNGGIIINPTNSTPLGFIGYRDDFTIGVAGSPMNDGDTVLTIHQSGFIRKTVDMFLSGVNTTIDDPDTGVFDIESIIYSPDYITITLSYPVVNGQRYTVTGLIYGAAIAPPSGGGTELPDQIGHEGQILFTDGVGNLYWGDARIDYGSADFEVDGVTVVDPRLAHNTYDLFLNQISRNLLPSEFTVNPSGGYTILLEDFNAALNDYQLYADLKGADS